MKNAFLALGAVVLALATGMWIGGHPENLPDGARDFFVDDVAVISSASTTSDQAAAVIQQKYWRETDPVEVQDASVRGMISRLREQYNDRFSHYFDAKQLSQFNESIEGSFSGVGMTVGTESKKGLRVGFVFRGSPADEAGIEAGDVIVTVDGESIKGEAVDLTVAKIKGPEGSEVTLGIQVAGKGEPKDFTLTRRQIRVPITSNRVKEVDGRTLGYVRLTTFSKGAGESLRRAVDKAIEKGAEGIVLDLRANGGGLLPEAVLTSSVFLDKGEVVVSTKSRTEGDETYRAVGGNIDPIPMAVLVNRDTASAAEILAGALQAVNDVPVVGTRSFGKGVFQQVINLESGGALDLTVGEFFTADGVSLAGKGLKPDVRVPLPPRAKSDLQLNEAFDVVSGEVDESDQDGDS